MSRRKPHPDVEMARAYVRASVGRWPQLSAETGITWDWLRAFAGGRLTDPGYAKVRALLDRAREDVQAPE